MRKQIDWLVVAVVASGAGLVAAIMQRYDLAACLTTYMALGIIMSRLEGD